MRPFGVVVLSPLLLDNFHLLEALEDLSIQQFIPEVPVEALIVHIQGIPGFHEQGLSAYRFHTDWEGLRNQFRDFV